MNIQTINNSNITVAIVESSNKVISDTQSALDFIMNVKYETGADRIVIQKENIIDDFFILSTGVAGEILQKFINYHIKIAIYGDFSVYTSKPLKDFIYESNKGNNIFFTNTKQDAIEKMFNAR